MSVKERKRAKFYQEDIVEQISSPGSYGMILRCWHDAEDLPMDNPLMDPLLRPLARGEVGVSLFQGFRGVFPESEFRLIDRAFHPGDLCKRSIDDVRSGVITNVEVKGRLEHAISGEPVYSWKTMADVRTREQAEIGDYVIYDDWVGQLYDEAVVELDTGELLRLPELSSRLTVGDKGSHILHPPQNLIGYIINNNRTGTKDTVVAVLHTVLAIAWLAINQSLDPVEAQFRRRPDRFWHGPALSKLTLISPKVDQLRVGDKVELKHVEHLPATIHGQVGDPAGRIAVQTYAVKETRSTVTVLWQDGTLETLMSTELIPYLNPDESDCWPGDHVFWKSEGQQRHAVVQSVNAAERMAAILYPDTGAQDLASLLELDPHGVSDFSAAQPNPAREGLGVHRGDFVLIHRPGTTNGLEKPRVPFIGESEIWVRETPVSVDGKLTGWRRAMSELGASIASRRGLDNSEGQLRRLSKDDSSLSWFGEVTELRLDGTVEVTAPDSSVAVYPVERLTRLYDTLEQIDDMWGDDMSDGQDEPEFRDNEHLWAMDETGAWQPQSVEDADEWEEAEDEGEDMEEGMDVDLSSGWEEEQQTGEKLLSSWLVPFERTPSLHEESPQVEDASPEPSTSVPDPPMSLSAACAVNGDHDRADIDSEPLKRFHVLPTAPPDHAFYSTPPGQYPKSFLTRLIREYRVLESSLPESIIVRAYEDRTYLLRSLIIGPENTPYEDAPFVIDWMLDSNFPNSPPIAHFWSWTAGNGRVNPNLYEEGKVCLSILGTWGGDKTEIWSAARSSLLQALVSIQGLVLVKEPWFCEPAYEKLRGTEEGIVNSRLYSEKAYVLSRGFVRRALEMPLGGLEPEIWYIYYANKLLDKVVCDARRLIDKSSTRSAEDGSILSPSSSSSSSSSSTSARTAADADSDLAVPRLTAGGIIALERTLTKLQSLLGDAPP